VARDFERSLPSADRFADRAEAGAALAAQLVARHIVAGDEDAVVVGLPRGGVPVAAEVAAALGVPLDVIIVRKLGVPGQPELAMGAIGEGGVRVLEPQVLAARHVSPDQLAAVEAHERVELIRRGERLRRGRPPPGLAARTVVVVDDGLATGSTARAAVAVVRAAGASRVILAVPVAPIATVTEMATVADAVVCAATPEPFAAIGQWYRDFSATTDDDVVSILDACTETPG
jgi:putative phosphoribosyl transferase